MQELMLLVALLTLMALALPVFAAAETVLFDFEKASELAAFHYEGKPAGTPVKELSLAEAYATSGRGSLKFITPAWKEGLPRWPAFECTPPLTDWSGYDRLVYDVTNVTEFTQHFSLFVTDSKVLTRGGLAYAGTLPPLSFTQVVVPLAGLADKKVDPRDIKTMHFFTADAPGDMVIYIDRICLLRKGDALPAVPASYIRQFAALQNAQPGALRELLRTTGAQIVQGAATVPGVAAWVQQNLKELDGSISDYEARLTKADPSVLEGPTQATKLQDRLHRLEAVTDLLVKFEGVRPRVAAKGHASPGTVVGFASSMQKVLPRAQVPDIALATTVDLSVARNEKEAFQVIVLPCGDALTQVRVQVTNLQTEDGKILAAANIDTPVMGYVETKSIPPYGSSHVGWWPDPILSFQTTADIAANDAQAFWIRVNAPKDQPAGVYTGKLQVASEGRPLFNFDLSVRVHNFRLPDRSPLPLAVTFGPHDHPLASTTAEQTKWRARDDYPINAWRKRRLEWGQFLSDYYLTYDSLYHRGMPDFEILQSLQKQGRLGMFNLGYYGPVGEGPEALEKWKQDVLPRVRAAYDKAKELGMLDHAYIYGADEANPEFFGGVQRAAEVLKQEFPGVLVMTTTYDHSYGLESVIKSMDAFCPLTPRFDAAKAAKARALGKQVWWYICCGPHHPSANMFVEYPAIEGRLLMGALTAKYRPDGFLYYQTSIWNSEKPITSGPFTDWDPRSWTTYHGDGSWICVGPDGTPLPTIRLENFRDGLEDYAYARILEETIKKVEAQPDGRTRHAEWLAQAKAALAVPESVATSGTAYTSDPRAVLQWREDMAAAIDAAPVPAAEL
jgi:hypothetical protein